MTEDDINHVQSSFKQVVPISDQAAAMFYGRLFEIAPHVKPLFKGDIAQQGTKLMTTLGVVVNGLREPETIVPAAQQLAVRHLEYGVTADHYAHVGDALLWTLERGLGDAFSDPVKSAWENAYALVSGVMIDAAYPQAAE